MTEIRFEQYNEWEEKWEDCKVEDLCVIGYEFYIDNEEYELGDFVKELIRKLEDAEFRALTE
jgi:hypothetical protein